MLFWPIDKTINLVGEWFGWTDPEKPFSLKTFLHGKIKEGITAVGKIFGFDEKEIEKLLDFNLTDFLFGKPDGVVTKTVGYIKKMFEGVSKFFKDLFGMEEGDDVGIDVAKMFGGVDFQMPNMEELTKNILATIGEKINLVFQDLAEKVFNFLPDLFDINATLAGLFADAGASAAEMMGAKSISKFNVSSGEMDKIKIAPTRPPASATGGGGGAGAGSAVGGGTNVDASSHTEVNQSNNSSFVAPVSPHPPAAGGHGRAGGYGTSAGMWG